MKKYLFIFTASLFFSVNCLAQEVFILDQENLINEANQNAPTIDKIRNSFLAAQNAANKIEERFSPQLESNFSRFNTNQDSFITYMPLVSPISNFSIGVTKNFSGGINFGLYNILERQTYYGYGTDSKNAIAVKLSVDLYKDIFGSTSRAEIKSADLQKQIAQIQGEIDKNNFLINLRRIYFTLSFNEEAIAISEKLLDLSKIQDKEIKQRNKSGIADESDVARQSSQLSVKNFNIAILKNNRELLIRSLKELLPSIAAKEVQIKTPDINAETLWMQKMISKIKEQKTPPKQYTSYNKIVDLTAKSYKEQRKITKKYDDLDLQLYSQYKQYGRDNSAGGSFKNTSSSAENSYEIGLQLKVPLGSAKSESRKTQEEIDKISLSKNREIVAKIESYHTQTITNILLLESALEFQKSDISSLEKVVAADKKKYDQARIALHDLIDDQNLYMQKKLGELGVKLTIANQILDYTSIFNEFPLR